MALWSMARVGAGDGAQEIQSSRHAKLAENCVELIRHRSRRDASQLGNFAMAVAFYEKLHGLPFGAGQTTLQLEIASRKVHEVARWAARVRGNGGAVRSRATHRVCELRDGKRDLGTGCRNPKVLEGGTHPGGGFAGTEIEIDASGADRPPFESMKQEGQAALTNRALSRARSDGKSDRPLGNEGVGHRSPAGSYGLPQLQDGDVLARVGS